MDGLGLAETTPGPLIMVVQFVGFMGAWQHRKACHGWLASTLGALLTTWVAFTSCFLWIFLGGPHIEQLRDNVKLASALSAITAAVVGVVLNLALGSLYACFSGRPRRRLVHRDCLHRRLRRDGEVEVGHHSSRAERRRTGNSRARSRHPVSPALQRGPASVHRSIFHQLAVMEDTVGEELAAGFEIEAQLHASR